MTGWSDVDDHGRPKLRDEWRAVPDSPPVVVATEVVVPVGLTDCEVNLKQYQ